MSQLGLNKKKSGLNEDLQEYERDLRAKLDRKQSNIERQSMIDDTKSVKSVTTRHRSLGKEKSQVKFDEEMLKQTETSRHNKWKQGLFEIKEKTNLPKLKPDTMSRAAYSRADFGGVVSTNKAVAKLKNEILSQYLEKDKHGLLATLSQMKR